MAVLTTVWSIVHVANPPVMAVLVWHDSQRAAPMGMCALPTGRVTSGGLPAMKLTPVLWQVEHAVAVTVPLLCSEVEMTLNPPLPGVSDAVWQSPQSEVEPTGICPLAG